MWSELSSRGRIYSVGCELFNSLHVLYVVLGIICEVEVNLDYDVNEINEILFFLSYDVNVFKNTFSQKSLAITISIRCICHTIGTSISEQTI